VGEHKDGPDSRLMRTNTFGMQSRRYLMEMNQKRCLDSVAMFLGSVYKSISSWKKAVQTKSISASKFFCLIRNSMNSCNLNMSAVSSIRNVSYGRYRPCS
jgi:hypothetical protein